MTKWLQLILILAIIGVSKAQIKLIVLAVLGLAGLWMVHTLAQDYQKISGSSSNQYFSGIAKRSIDEKKVPKLKELKFPSIDWDRVITNDPSSCARSFTCQLAAVPEEDLQDYEKAILSTIRESTAGDSWAETQIRKALKYGENDEKEKDRTKCQKQYKQCPYTLRTMMKLLKLLGDFEDIQNNLSTPMFYT